MNSEPIYLPPDALVEDDELGEVIVCAGPAACPFIGDAAIENAKAGCPRCRRIRCTPDGLSHEYQLKAH